MSGFQEVLYTINIQTSQAQVQYRSEISGLCTRKTHAQFLCKCVLKNTCFGTRLRASDAHFSFCYSLSSMAFFSSFSQQKARPKAVPTNTGKNISADKQTADKFWPCAWCWCTVATHWQTYDFYPNILLLNGLNVNENNPNHGFSVILQYRSNVSWQSLEAWYSKLDSRSSMLKNFEDRG